MNKNFFKYAAICFMLGIVAAEVIVLVILILWAW